MSTLTWSEITEANGFDIAGALGNWSSAVDPYLVWAYVTNFEYLIQVEEDETDPTSKYIPIAIELEDITVKDFVDFMTPPFGEAVVDVLSISYLYRDTPVALEDTRFLTAQAKVPDFFASLMPGGKLFGKIKRFELGLAIEPSPPLFGFLPYTMLSPKLAEDVPMGQQNINFAVIDDGIGFVNNAVLAKDGSSRLKYFWNQNSVSTEAEEKLLGFKSGTEMTTSSLGGARPGFYGWQIGGEEIKAWFAKINLKVTTEAAIYSAYDYYAVGQSVSHGTHMLDTAAGFDYEVDTSASSAEQLKLDATNIFAVQLGFPSRKFADSSGRWLAVNLLDAIRYSLLRGDELLDSNGRVKPMVFNISMGNLAGPHDGSSLFESALDEILSLRNNYIDADTCRPRENNIIECMLSSGNQKEARSHAKFDVEGGAEQSIIWRVLPDDATPSFLELWIPETHIEEAECENIVIEIEPPSGGRHISGNLTCGKTWTLDKDGKIQCVVVYLPPKKMSTGRNGMVLIALAPTNGVLNATSMLPGEWKITVKNQGTSGVSMSAWIQRDESTFDRPIRGRQGRFVDEEFEPRDEFGYPKNDDTDNQSYIRLHGTLSAIATGTESKAIGAYRYSDAKERYYSGSGGAGMKEVSALTVADDSVTCRGIVAAGSFSGSRAALDGTSAAAAQATRTLLTGGVVPSNGDKVPSSAAEVRYKSRRIGHKKT